MFIAIQPVNFVKLSFLQTGKALVTREQKVYHEQKQYFV